MNVCEEERATFNSCKPESPIFLIGYCSTLILILKSPDSSQAPYFSNMSHICTKEKPHLIVREKAF